MLASLNVIKLETSPLINILDKKLSSFVLSTTFENIFKYLTLSIFGVKSDLVYDSLIIPFENPNNFLKFM